MAPSLDAGATCGAARALEMERRPCGHEAAWPIVASRSTGGSCRPTTRPATRRGLLPVQHRVLHHRAEPGVTDVELIRFSHGFKALDLPPAMGSPSACTCTACLGSRLGGGLAGRWMAFWRRWRTARDGGQSGFYQRTRAGSCSWRGPFVWGCCPVSGPRVHDVDARRAPCRDPAYRSNLGH